MLEGEQADSSLVLGGGFPRFLGEFLLVASTKSDTRAMYVRF
jgi:hypothetical protein